MLLMFFFYRNYRCGATKFIFIYDLFVLNIYFFFGRKIYVGNCGTFKLVVNILL